MASKKTLVLAMVMMGCSGTAASESADPREAQPVVEAPRDDGGSAANDAGDAGAADATPAPDAAPPKPDAGAPDAGGTCATRKDGAFVTFDFGAESLTIWSTNTKFNQEAFLASAQGKQVTPVFEKLLDGFDCDGQWTWHVDPNDLAFEDGADASCNALPSAVEANKAHWLGTIGRYCPAKRLISAFQAK